MDYSSTSESDAANESETFISDAELDTFPELEREFNAVQMEFEDRFDTPESYKIYKALFNEVYNARQKLIQGAKINLELNSKITSTRAKLQDVYAKIMNNTATIEALNLDIECKHRLIDEAHAREQDACEIIDNMKKTIQHLEQEIKEHRELDQMGDEEVVVIRKSSLEKDCERLLKKVEFLNEKLKKTIECQEDLEQKTDECDVRIEVITEKLHYATEEFSRFRNIKMRKNDEFEGLQRELSFTEKEKAILTDSMTAARSKVVYLDKTLNDRRANMAYCVRDLVDWNKKFCKLQIACDLQIDKIRALKVETQQTTLAINYQNALESRLRDQIDEIKERTKASWEKGQRFTRDTVKIAKEMETLQSKFKTLNISEEKAIMMRYKREYISMLRMRNIIITNINKEKRLVDKGFDLIALRNNETQKLEEDIFSHEQRLKQQRLQIAYLQKQVQQLHEEAENREYDREELADLMAQVQVNLIKETKKLNEQKIQWRILNEAYDSLVMDKNVFMATYDATIEKNAKLAVEWQQKNCIVDMVCKVMKQKECAVQNAKDMTACLQDDIADMRKTLKQAREGVAKLREEYFRRRSAAKNLRDHIAVIQVRIRKHNEMIEALVGERDVLSAQTQARNNELLLLYKKLDIMCDKSKYGVLIYKRRIDDIKLLKKEVKRLRLEKARFYDKITNVVDNRSEITKLHQDLMRERIKSSLMEREMKQTLNVHRWRTLEERDPIAFKVLQWIGLAQKRNVATAHKVATDQVLLKEAKTLYNALRKMAARQPGPATYSLLESKRKCLKEARQFEEELKRDIKQKQVEQLVRADKVKKVERKVHEVRVRITRLQRHHR